MMQIVVDNHPYYLRPEQVVEWLKLRLGYVEEIMFHNGDILTKLSSISFSSMGQSEFQDFFNKALYVIVTEVIPISRQELIDELETILGEKVGSWVEQ